MPYCVLVKILVYHTNKKLYCLGCKRNTENHAKSKEKYYENSFIPRMAMHVGNTANRFGRGRFYAKFS